MIIPSIDISNGKVVQLKKGSELVVERDDPEKIMREFLIYGEPAIIDLDAARGTGSNKMLIKSLLKLGSCRVGGGIRTIEDAREWIRAGASKIIIASAVFEKLQAPNATVSYKVNRKFLKALVGAVGRNRILIALDVRGELVVINGWQENTELSIFSVLPLLEQYTSGFLVTAVDREGLMGGTDISLFAKLRAQTPIEITAAGGITETKEIQELAKLDIDVQLGMALYTGKLSLKKAFIASLNWEGDLLPVIAQAKDGTVLMLGYADSNAIDESFSRKKLCFYSRSRKRLWMKGENSGNTLELLKLRTDCDRDTLLATVKPAGPVCHKGTLTCFGEKEFTLLDLQETIMERFKNPRPGSYTATLDDIKVREKLMEEAAEVCEAETKEEVIWEASDVLYFLLVLVTRKEISFTDVVYELKRRNRSRG